MIKCPLLPRQSRHFQMERDGSRRVLEGYGMFREEGNGIFRGEGWAWAWAWALAWAWAWADQIIIDCQIGFDSVRGRSYVPSPTFLF